MVFIPASVCFFCYFNEVARQSTGLSILCTRLYLTARSSWTEQVVPGLFWCRKQMSIQSHPIEDYVSLF